MAPARGSSSIALCAPLLYIAGMSSPVRHPNGAITICPKCFDPDRSGAVCTIICDEDGGNARGGMCKTPLCELEPLFADSQFLARWKRVVDRGIEAVAE